MSTTSGNKQFEEFWEIYCRDYGMRSEYHQSEKKAAYSSWNYSEYKTRKELAPQLRDSLADHKSFIDWWKGKGVITKSGVKLSFFGNEYQDLANEAWKACERKCLSNMDELLAVQERSFTRRNRFSIFVFWAACAVGIINLIMRML